MSTVDFTLSRLLRFSCIMLNKLIIKMAGRCMKMCVLLYCYMGQTGLL